MWEGMIIQMTKTQGKIINVDENESTVETEMRINEDPVNNNDGNVFSGK